MSRDVTLKVVKLALYRHKQVMQVNFYNHTTHRHYREFYNTSFKSVFLRLGQCLERQQKFGRWYQYLSPHWTIFKITRNFKV